MNNRAIIFGASGLTGSTLLSLLCEQEYYAEVICFVRKQIHNIHDKQRNILTDFNDLESHAALFQHADVYCCLGTTNKNVNNDKEAYREADLYRPLRIAKLLKANNGKQLLIISAMGADENARIFYNKLKGELQRKLIEMQLPCLHIFQPSLLLGDRREHRSGEKFATALMAFIQPMLVGGWRKYRAIHVKSVAKAMFVKAKQSGSGNHIYTSDIIQQIADAG